MEYNEMEWKMGMRMMANLNYYSKKNNNNNNKQKNQILVCYI